MNPNMLNSADILNQVLMQQSFRQGQETFNSLMALQQQSSDATKKTLDQGDASATSGGGFVDAMGILGMFFGG